MKEFQSRLVLEKSLTKYGRLMISAFGSLPLSPTHCGAGSSTLRFMIRFLEEAGLTESAG